MTQELRAARIATQHCPICSAVVAANPRYPRYVCEGCAVKASASDGRLLEFSNVDASGGFTARYADTRDEYPSHECFIDGVKCHANEARFGGIVIEAVFVVKRIPVTVGQTIANQQSVGNIGLFYVCYRLSRLGWNVMPTTRNAKGIDSLIYSQDASQKRTIQLKTLSKGSPVPLSNNLDHLFADFVIVCRHVISETPECFVLTPEEVSNLAHRGEKNGKISYWLQPPNYATIEFRETWERIGSGLSQ